MRKLKRTDILSLESYAEQRADIRPRVIAHKKARRLILGPHASIHFEDRETMRYQVQEMLRVERIFDRAGIEAEINTYNELIPNGSNWKATLLFEFEDATERARELAKLAGVEDQIFIKVGSNARNKAHANDDMPRSNENKTAAVHFLRFEFTASEIQAMKQGEGVTLEIDHPQMPYKVSCSEELIAVLLHDFDD